VPTAPSASSVDASLPLTLHVAPGNDAVEQHAPSATRASAPRSSLPGASAPPPLTLQLLVKDLRGRQTCVRIDANATGGDLFALVGAPRLGLNFLRRIFVFNARSSLHPVSRVHLSLFSPQLPLAFGPRRPAAEWALVKHCLNCLVCSRFDKSR